MKKINQASYEKTIEKVLSLKTDIKVIKHKHMEKVRKL